MLLRPDVPCSLNAQGQMVHTAHGTYVVIYINIHNRVPHQWNTLSKGWHTFSGKICNLLVQTKSGGQTS